MPHELDSLMAEMGKDMFPEPTTKELATVSYLERRRILSQISITMAQASPSVDNIVERALARLYAENLAEVLGRIAERKRSK